MHFIAHDFVGGRVLGGELVPVVGNLQQLSQRRGDEEVTLTWLAERLTEFVDVFPESAAEVDRLASWLARLDDDVDE